MSQPKLPGSWEELTWEQLVMVHRLLAKHSENRAVRNLEVYLYLTGLEIAEGEGEIAENGSVTYYLRKVNSRKVKNRLHAAIDTISKAFSTIYYSLFTSKKVEEFFSVKADDLTLYLGGCHLNDDDKHKVNERLRKKVERQGALDWLDDPLGLTVLPEETLRMGKRVWVLPAQLVTNLTYEQYGNMQKLMQAVWTLTEQLQGEEKEMREAMARLAGKSGENSGGDDGTPGMPGTSGTSERSDEDELKPIMQRMEATAREVGKYRAQFLAHALVERIGEDDSEYKSNVAERNIGVMERWAPEYLFDIVVQHLQSCLKVYKGQFPELFSKDGGAGRDVIPLVSEVDTINAIQKWQGYQEQQKVYDTNAVFVFSILNSMTKEAKAIEEANAKMKSHRSR